jgi:putative ABC transport system permease protein
MSVRLALGASRASLLRQLLTESVVLSLAGGALGILLAKAGLRTLVALAGSSLPRAETIGLDPAVLAFTTVVSLVTGFALGLLPAVRVSRSEMAEALRDGARGSTEGAGRSRVRSILVASEVALALVLLAGAGLAIRSFAALRAVDPGFDPHGVLSAVVSVYGTAEARRGRRETFPSAVERVRRLPGVELASHQPSLPIAGDVWGSVYHRGPPSSGACTGAEQPSASCIRLLRDDAAADLRGRDVAETDRVGAPGRDRPTFSPARYWPNEDAIGKRVTSIQPPNTAPRGFRSSAWSRTTSVGLDGATRGRGVPPVLPGAGLPRTTAVTSGTDAGGRASCSAVKACNVASLAPALRDRSGIDQSGGACDLTFRPWMT